MAEKVYHIAICDDTPMEAELLAARLAEYGRMPGRPAVTTQIFGSAEAFGAALKAGHSFDAAFMDVILPGQDGIGFVRGLRAAGNRLPVVFLSNSPEYATEAKALGALACLTKPVRKEVLHRLLDDLRQSEERRQAEAQNDLTAEDGSTFFARDIVYAEAKGARVRCHLADGRTVFCRAALPHMAAWLGRANVARLDKTLAVDMDKVSSFSPGGLVMKDGTCLKAPRTRQKQWAARYMDYLARRR